MPIIFKLRFYYKQNNSKLGDKQYKLKIMIIERTKKEVVFRLPGNLSVDDLQDMTDWLEFIGLAKRSKAVQKDVNDLVKKIKKGRWAKTKLFLGL